MDKRESIIAVVDRKYMSYNGHAHQLRFDINSVQVGHRDGSICLCLAGYGTPRDLADVAVDAVLSMDGQPAVLQQSAVLAGIASVRQVYDQQVWGARFLWRSSTASNKG